MANVSLTEMQLEEAVVLMLLVLSDNYLLFANLSPNISC